MATKTTWRCEVIGGPRNGRVISARPCIGLVFTIREPGSASAERHIYVLARAPDAADSTALFVWDRAEISNEGEPRADPDAFHRHWQRFDRTERSRILTLRALADFLAGKVAQRESAGEQPNRARAEVAALRWVLGRIGADSVVSRRVSAGASNLPSDAGPRSNDAQRSDDERG